MKIIVQEHGTNQWQPEERLVVEYFKDTEHEVYSMGLSELKRKGADIRAADLVVGNLSFMRDVFRLKGIALGQELCYPRALFGHMYRVIAKSNVRCLQGVVERAGPRFVKPAGRCKRFTGLVVSDPDCYALKSIGRAEPIWIADVVEWISEYRYYVVDSNIVFAAHYAGTAQLPDIDVVLTMIEAMRDKPGYPQTYALDVGILSTGQTALVELNEAYSIGAYGDIPAATYVAFLQARWKSLQL